MPALSHAQASLIAATVLAEGAARGFAPLCCIVLDAGGNPLALLRHEAAAIHRPEVARAKAAGCLGMGFGGRELQRRAQLAPAFFAALSAIMPHGLLAVPGGVLIRDAAGTLLGAVGVSGDTADNDEICAVAAIAAAGLTPDTGFSPAG